ncbi:GPW/gp25 family protein [Vibrio quintilis]|uniref:Gene 25-like lysozyme n=1 Tax=Vibrio quintilis TaxID=1117707 RepID=A0A1M7YV13_9VIBR|nr:GPW/gp25 family protein [Vibrio quintilis]SHO56462.1 Gene 25-like lysozyme [Vibrio quintilis]
MDESVIGTGWKFPPRFANPQTGPDMSDEMTLLEEAIRILLNTQVGERPLEPELGCGLDHFMFSEATPLTLMELKEEIAAAIVAWEPRIDLLNIQFDLAEIYDGKLNILLEYEVRQTNARNNMVFPFYLAEKSI